jgi:hypothetical protein
MYKINNVKVYDTSDKAVEHDELYYLYHNLISIYEQQKCLDNKLFALLNMKSIDDE